MPNPLGQPGEKARASLGAYVNRSQCYEKAIAALAHPDLGAVTRVCTGLQSWGDQFTCYSRAFANLQPLYVGHQSAKPVLRRMCIGLTTWDDQALCFARAVKRAGFREIDAACASLEYTESRSKCFEKALQ